MEPIEVLEACVVSRKSASIKYTGITPNLTTRAWVKMPDGTEYIVNESCTRIPKKVSKKAGVRLISKRAKAAAEALEIQLRAAFIEAAEEKLKDTVAMDRARKRAEVSNNQKRIQERKAAIFNLRSQMQKIPDLRLEEVISLWNITQVEDVMTS